MPHRRPLKLLLHNLKFSGRSHLRSTAVANPICPHTEKHELSPRPSSSAEDFAEETLEGEKRPAVPAGQVPLKLKIPAEDFRSRDAQR
ncbi:hypothetical protein HPB47_020725 [Ixodes persulcatus]|uniref:Uncharacterized protein n=1 Tax=Ixodes persulcatus TaxID=34615 RepID=A0AC60QEM5_IXOPE|nr:hypothetical protein HPB47_020725 [Ixodes persulcatus]